MSRRRLLFQLVFKAAWVRKDRALTALVSVAVVATIATTALTLYLDLENKLSREFRRFGANVIVKNPQGRPITPDELAAMRHPHAKDDAAQPADWQIAPVAYAIATAPDGSRVVVGGTEIAAFRELNSWWSVRETGNPRTEVLLGSRAARALSPAGKAFTLTYGNHSISLRPELVFTSGSDDDSLVYLDLKQFMELAGVQPNTALLRITGRPQEIQQSIARLSTALPGLEVRPVRQITEAQTVVVGKTRSLVLAACAVIVILIMLCMIATLTSAVLERRRDFAVMKALGASNRILNFLFAAEASLLALAGAGLGFAAGSAIAYWIGKTNFDAAILPQPALVPAIVLGSLTMALLAATAPLRLLRQIQPAAILRGE